MAQHGNTSTQRSGFFGRIVEGWNDVTHAQRRVFEKNRPWIDSSSVHQARHYFI